VMTPSPPWARATLAGPGAIEASAALATANASATDSARRLARAAARPRFISHPPCGEHLLSRLRTGCLVRAAAFSNATVRHPGGEQNIVGDGHTA
jgi:hypothetical protein